MRHRSARTHTLCAVWTVRVGEWAGPSRPAPPCPVLSPGRRAQRQPCTQRTATQRNTTQRTATHRNATHATTQRARAHALPRHAAARRQVDGVRQQQRPLAATRPAQLQARGVCGRCGRVANGRTTPAGVGGGGAGSGEHRAGGGCVCLTEASTRACATVRGRGKRLRVCHSQAVWRSHACVIRTGAAHPPSPLHTHTHTHTGLRQAAAVAGGGRRPNVCHPWLVHVECGHVGRARGAPHHRKRTRRCGSSWRAGAVGGGQHGGGGGVVRDRHRWWFVPRVLLRAILLLTASVGWQCCR
jgi:hypothetical protein